MVTPIDIERLLKDNPQVDPEKLAEGLEFSKKLAASGLPKSEPRIISPHDRYRARVVDSRGHRHLVHLRNP